MGIIEAQNIEKSYKKHKSNLSTKEKDILTRYYGIHPNVRHTLAEIGTIYGVTRERIRQIKVEALKKIYIIK